MSESELVIKVTDKNFQTEVLESKVPVVVDFWAHWCGPCLALAPILDSIAEEFAGSVKICKVNVEQNPELAAKFNVRNIPYLAFIKDGQKAGDMVGNQPRTAIVDKIKAL